MDLKSRIRNIADFPKKGIVFRDISTLLQDKKAFNYSIERLAERYLDKRIDMIAAIESRGFIFGGALADRMEAGFVPVRKLGKLPYETVKKDYTLEYGYATLEMHKDAIHPGQRVLIVDDLIATGGTLLATCGLVEKLGGVVAGIAVLIELSFLKGREKFSKYDFHSIIQYESE
ncbi:MAG: adenine phosphoribosyltransferase [candidate division Zixibacteria bacterium]|nr:adenine phosphoribosyltransferase [candidate division Zixibacteria bacterium]